MSALQTVRPKPLEADGLGESPAGAAEWVLGVGRIGVSQGYPHHDDQIVGHAEFGPQHVRIAHGVDGYGGLDAPILGTQRDALTHRAQVEDRPLRERTGHTEVHHARSAEEPAVCREKLMVEVRILSGCASGQRSAEGQLLGPLAAARGPCARKRQIGLGRGLRPCPRLVAVAYPLQHLSPGDVDFPWLRVGPRGRVQGISQYLLERLPGHGTIQESADSTSVSQSVAYVHAGLLRDSLHVASSRIPPYDGSC